MVPLRPTRELAALLAVAALLVLVGTPTPARALDVRYVAQDLPEGPGDPDRWQLVYEIDPADWAAVPDAAGFSIAFDVDTAANLAGALGGPGPDWDVLFLQPDPLLPASGFYDALALAAVPSFAGPFAVSFDWLGAGAPGSQAFTVYDDTFAIIESGFTVPEPGTAVLVALGLLHTAWRGRGRAGCR